MPSNPLTESYSLRTLAAPELRRSVALAFGLLALGGGIGSAATVMGSVVGVVPTLVLLFVGLAALKPVDERARRIDA